MTPQSNIQNRSFYSGAYSTGWKISKYSLLANIYFFFNAFLLPKGLLYTTVLSPVFYYNTLKHGRKTYAIPFFSVLLVFDLFHLWAGVNLGSFIVSNALFILTYFCVISFYHFINGCNFLGRIFREILLFNAGMTLIAIPFFFAPRPYMEWFWYINKLTAGVEAFPRLALLTYEASYYSLLLIPVWYYYLFKFSFGQIQNHKWTTLLLISVPMLMSLSFGVIGASLLTLIILCLIFSRRLFRYKRPFLMICGSLAALLVGLGLLWLFFPENAFFIRMGNIFSGADTSTNGRTRDSFAIAWQIAQDGNLWIGSGLGQIKHIITELIHSHFRHWGNFARYDIPNAMGETLAIFGICGVVLRLFLEVWLFFKTKVYTNYYRLALFIFVFIYQFTGSFITNTVEYVIWILAFSNVFVQFNISRRA